MMESLIADSNALLAQDKGSFRELKKVKGFLPAPLARHRKYYQEEGCSSVPAALNDSMTDLLKSSLDTVAKKNVFFSAAEAKELEVSLGSICSVTSWLDHWLNAFGRSSMDPTRDEAAIRRLLQSGSKALFFLARQANNSWTNLKLKRRESVLEALVTGCTAEDTAALRNGTVDTSDRLFPEEVVLQVTKKLRTRSETEALRKVAFSTEKKRSSPSRGHMASSSGRQPKAQKTSNQAIAPSSSSGSSDKGFEQPFLKTSGSARGRKKGKGKKRGGTK